MQSCLTIIFLLMRILAKYLRASWPRIGSTWSHFHSFLPLIMLFLPSNSIFCFAHQSLTRPRSEFPGKLQCVSAGLGRNYKHLSHSVLASGSSQLPAGPLGAAVFDLALTQPPLLQSYEDYFGIYHHSMWILAAVPSPDSLHQSLGKPNNSVFRDSDLIELSKGGVHWDLLEGKGGAVSNSRRDS